VSRADCQQTPQAPASPPVNTEPAEERVLLQSETLEFDPSSKRLTATGKVVVTYKNSQIFADRLELNTDTGVGTASGTVRLHSPEDDIQAARMDFNLTEERGVLYDSSGVVAKIFQVAGERITRLGPKTLRVQRGRVTTCTGPVPDWEFRARAARIGLGDYVSLQQPSFWVKGLPVFYLPYLLLPLRDERTTGFLPPRFGLSEDDGARIFTEFFWAIADWIDATLGVEYFSKRGVLSQAELRYAIDPLSSGRLEGAFIRDQETHETLWRVLVQQQQEFGWGVRGLTQIDVRSEGDLLRRFSSDIRQESEVRTISFGTLTKLFPDSSLTLAGESYDGLPEAGLTEQFRRFPTLQYTQFPTALLGGQLFFALDTSYSRLRDTLIANATPVQRLDFFPRLTLPVSLASWLRLTVTGGLRETFYSRQENDSGSASRLLGEGRASLVGPTLWRRYSRPGASQAVVHMIESRLDYRYVPAVGQGDLPPFAALDETLHFLDPLETLTLLDRIQPANYARLALINRVYTHGLGSPGSVQEVARLRLSQGMDVRSATEGNGQLLGPSDLELTLVLWQRLQLTSVLRWDAAQGELQEANWRSTLTLAPGWAVYAFNNNRFVDPQTRYVTGGMFVTLSERLQVGYHTRYDGLSGVLREHLLTLDYRAQCWRVMARYRVRDLGDTDFFVNVELFRF
jgi:LPS-assembly protein